VTPDRRRPIPHLNTPARTLASCDEIINGLISAFLAGTLLERSPQLHWHVRVHLWYCVTCAAAPEARLDREIPRIPRLLALGMDTPQLAPCLVGKTIQLDVVDAAGDRTTIGGRNPRLVSRDGEWFLTLEPVPGSPLPHRAEVPLRDLSRPRLRIR
jgi:hypothetical protein